MLTIPARKRPRHLDALPPLLFERKSPRYPIHEKVIVWRDIALVLAGLTDLEFQFPDYGRFRPTPLQPVTEPFQMRLVLCPVEREIVRVGQRDKERHRLLINLRHQFQHSRWAPPRRLSLSPVLTAYDRRTGEQWCSLSGSARSISPPCRSGVTGPPCSWPRWQWRRLRP